MERQGATPNTPATTASGAPATDTRSPSLWFGVPSDDPDRRPQLTRERVVEGALAVIAHDGANALSMRRLAARLGVVPGALYNHVRNKQQLHDLLLGAQGVRVTRVQRGSAGPAAEQDRCQSSADANRTAHAQGAPSTCTVYSSAPAGATTGCGVGAQGLGVSVIDTQAGLAPSRASGSLV